MSPMLIKDSFKVLSLDKELLLYPLCSTLSLIILWAGGVYLSYSVVFTNLLVRDFDTGSSTFEPIFFAVILAFYIVTHFIITFFNTALISAVLIRLEGRNPTLMDGFKMASARFKYIVVWSILSATLSVILKILEKRLPFFQSMMARFLGLGFSLCSYFVVPFFVQEKLYPIAALKKSSQLIKKVWGRALIAEVGVALLGFMMFFLGVALVVGVNYFTVGLTAYLLLGLVVYVGLLSLLYSTVSGIVTASVYAYGTTGVVHDGFSEESFKSAFRE